MIHPWRKSAIVCGVLLALLTLPARAQKDQWRQASPTELETVLPARALVGPEHIETEMRTASGIVDSHGRFIAGVVLITAGYSADGKYSHYVMVQAPMRVGGIALAPGNYVFGWTREGAEDALSVRFYVAATGQFLGTATAHWIQGTNRVESLHIWPPTEKALIQIGRFGISYQLGKP